MTVGVTGQGADPFYRDGAENAYGKSRPVAPDTAAGQEPQAMHPLVIDDRKQRYVETVFKKPVNQARWKVQLKVDPVGLFKPVDQRLGVEKADAAEAKDGSSEFARGGRHLP